MATAGVSNVKSKVLEILARDPDLPYSTIGGLVGVTRERVRQIARKNGYPSRIGRTENKPEKICQVCGKTFYKKTLYCSVDCGYKARRKRVILICKQCGGIIERPPGTVRNKNGNYFCNRACYRKWISNRDVQVKRNRKSTAGDFKHKIGLKEEFPLKNKIPALEISENDSKGEIFLKGKIPASEVLKIYNILLRLHENKLVAINITGFDDFKELGRAIKRRSKKQDTGINNGISAIIDIKKHSLLFVLRLTD